MIRCGGDQARQQSACLREIQAVDRLLQGVDRLAAHPLRQFLRQCFHLRQGRQVLPVQQLQDRMDALQALKAELAASARQPAAVASDNAGVSTASGICDTGTETS